MMNKRFFRSPLLIWSVFAYFFYCTASFAVEKPNTMATPDMEKLIEEAQIDQLWTTQQKINHLLDALFGENGDEFSYVPRLTLNAAQAFEQRQGNCLTFAILFVTLARNAGLDAHFNEVDFAPSWAQDGEVFVESGHVNIVVHGETQDYVIEWLDFYMDAGGQIANPISDERAFAHYYNNFASRALGESELSESRQLLDLAIEMDPSNANVLQNDGIYWLKVGDMKRAEKSLIKASRLAKKNSSIHYLLAEFYRKTENPKKAVSHEKKAKRNAHLNPFHLHKLALEAKEKEDYRQSIKLLKKAIHLMPTYRKLRYDLAKCYVASGSARDLEHAMAKAMQISRVADQSWIDSRRGSVSS